MILPGIGGFIAGDSTGAGFSSTMTVGNSEVEIAYDPKTGLPVTIEANGFGVGDATYGTFGSMTEDEWEGFPIVALYQEDGLNTTVFRVLGNASALTPTLEVDGVDQNLGAGSFIGGYTGFSGSATDPFAGETTVVVTIE